MRWLLGCCFALLSGAGWAQGEHPLLHDAAESSSDPVPYEEVLVSGEQPGPGLWKVANEERALWIVGTLLPVPKRMSWKSKDVEALLEEAQEVLIYGGLSRRPDIGWLRGLTLLPTAMRAARNPDGARLEDILPSELHAQWLALKDRYIGNDTGIERWRPTFAIQRLRSRATAKSNLVFRDSVNDLALKRAKQRKIKITTVGLEQTMHVEKPRAALKRFAKTPFADVECFANSLGRIEQDIADMRVRANAWAVGDIAALRNVSRATHRDDCVSLLIETALAGEFSEAESERQMLQRFVQEAEHGKQELARQWLAAAETALATNDVTLAVLPMEQILSADGYVAELRTRGYAVEEP